LTCYIVSECVRQWPSLLLLLLVNASSLTCLPQPLVGSPIDSFVGCVRFLFLLLCFSQTFSNIRHQIHQQSFLGRSSLLLPRRALPYRSCFQCRFTTTSTDSLYRADARFDHSVLSILRHRMPTFLQLILFCLPFPLALRSITTDQRIPFTSLSRTNQTLSPLPAHPRRT
jgi:hypothetical protein